MFANSILTSNDMRIDGSLSDRLIISDLPRAVICFIILNLHDRHHSDSIILEDFYVTVVVFLFFLIIELIDGKRFKSLDINNGFILGGKQIAINNIVSVRYKRGIRGNNRVIFEIKNNDGIEQVSVIDKPKLFSFFSKESKTLEYLYQYYPQLQEKEIKK